MKIAVFVALTLLAVVSCGTVSKNYGFDQTLDDPFLGQSLKFGETYLDVAKHKKAFWVAVKNRLGKDDGTMPLVIGNAGGPGDASLMWLFKGVGPYTVDISTGKISVNTQSITNYADYLLAEFPLGTCFSESKHPVKTQEQNKMNFKAFWTALVKMEPKLNKTRQIYLLGNDYAAKTLSGMGRVLREMGYNVQGQVYSAPWVSVHKILESSIENLYNKGSIWWTTYIWYRMNADLNSWMIRRGVFGANYYSLWTLNSPSLNMAGWWGWDTLDLYAPATDTRKTKYRAWNDEMKYFHHFMKSKQIKAQFKVLKGKCKTVSREAFLNLYLNDVHNSNKEELSATMHDGVKTVFNIGRYSLVVTLDSILRWLSKTAYAKLGFNNTSWVNTKWGRQRTWGNVCVNEVDDAGYYVQYDKPEVTYNTILNMIQGGKGC